MLPLPKTYADDAPRIIFGRMGGWDPAAFKPEEVMKVMMLVNDLMHEEDDQMIICGQVNIADMKDATLAHFLQFTPSMMKKMTMMMQEGLMMTFILNYSCN